MIASRYIWVYPRQVLSPQQKELRNTNKVGQYIMVYCVDKEHMDEVMKISRILLEFWMATCNEL